MLMVRSPRVLFILKIRETSGGGYGNYFSSGLYWSAKFVSDILEQEGVDSHLVQVTDNNDIDREVSKFKPDVVVIEALWVVPEKFEILRKLHPSVIWVVRIHSNVPFLANEGIAIDWIKGYDEQGITVAVNEKRALSDINTVLGTSGLEALYLPNYYPVKNKTALVHDGDFLNVACYGAIRPMKNQLIQAIAAIRFAESINKKLRFHINGTRVEMGGNTVLDNLRALFENTDHVLVEDSWMNHHEFLHRLRHMDLGMQVSLSETFSIVTADMVSVGLPIVVSHEIDWAVISSKANPTDSHSIVSALKLAYSFPGFNISFNRHGLKKYSRKSKNIWLDFLSRLGNNN
jgi:hypothetical protein